MPINKRGRLIAGFLAVAAAARLFFYLLTCARFEWSGPLRSESAAAWAMGRALLEGLTPYRDFFDIRPPGIFVVSAFSSVLTGDSRLIAMLEVGFLIGITVIPFLAVRSRSKNRSAVPWFLSVVPFLFFGLTAVAIMERGGQYRVDSFGCFFVVCYTTLLFRTDWNKSNLWIRQAVAALFLFSAFLFNEPFLLSACGAALIVCHNRASFIRGFVIPAAAAVGLALIVLALAGWLNPYLTIYLPTLFSVRFHKPDSALTPLFSSAYSAAVLYLACQMGLRLFEFESPQRKKHLAVLSAGLILGGATSFAPIAVALAFRFFDEEIFNTTQPVSLSAFIVSAFVALAAFGPLPPKKIDIAQSNAKIEAVLAARKLDAILGACGISSYVFLGGLSPGQLMSAYTHRLPAGPVFYSFPGFFNRGGWLRESLDKQIQAGKIIVVDGSTAVDMAAAGILPLDDSFSTTPWACVGTLPLLPDRYTIYYKKEL